MHTSESTWDNVTPGIWYGFVVIERPDGETDYHYAFSNVTDYAPDVEGIVPDGCTLLEYELYLTPKGREHMWRNGDRWSFEEQNGPDAVSYDAYDAQMTV